VFNSGELWQAENQGQKTAAPVEEGAAKTIPQGPGLVWG
jgi:hypothetical protein